MILIFAAIAPACQRRKGGGRCAQLLWPACASAERECDPPANSSPPPRRPRPALPTAWLRIPIGRGVGSATSGLWRAASEAWSKCAFSTANDRPAAPAAKAGIPPQDMSVGENVPPEGGLGGLP